MLHGVLGLTADHTTSHITRRYSPRGFWCEVVSSPDARGGVSRPCRWVPLYGVGSTKFLVEGRFAGPDPDAAPVCLFLRGL